MRRIRRLLLSALGAMALVCATAPVQAQAKAPIKIGFMTIKTGFMAGPGKDLQDGIDFLLKQRGGELAGHKIELISVDSTGQPATAKTKFSELVDLQKVDVIMGPLASVEAIALAGGVAQAKTPFIICNAGADDLTQRQASPWIIRTVATNSQPMQPFADYVLTKLKYKKIAVIGDETSYVYEALGGFQREFEKGGGKIVEKIYIPLGTPDYSSFIAKLPTDVDAIFAMFTGSSSGRFLKQYAAYGLKGKTPMLAAMTMTDEALFPQMGDEATGLISAGWYSATIDTPSNYAMAASFRKAMGHDPGTYAVGSYIAGLVLEDALMRLGNAPTKAELAKALRATKLKESPRGPISFDAYGNPVADMYIRKTEMKDGRLQNTIIATYPAVSQFWKSRPEEFLAQPVFSRSYPK